MITVLRSSESVDQARSLLAARGLDFSDYDHWRRWLPFRVLRRLHMLRPEFHVDPVKAWDVLQAIDFVTSNCQPQDPILDLGCKNSEILPCLSALGFTELTGIDLDRSVTHQPRFGAIHWRVGDFYETGFDSRSFKAVTAISTIEHGIDIERLVDEVSRLLTDNGIFLFSTDYHASKVDTLTVRAFGLDWSIFSREEILGLLSRLRDAGFTPVGDISLEHESTPIHWQGYDYTFLFGALRKQR